ncbi:MAG: hypothetical protein RLZZ522_836 [Verrucomicrobiota bacterium]|jgi:hypothetical protein
MIRGAWEAGHFERTWNPGLSRQIKEDLPQIFQIWVGIGRPWFEMS